MLCFWFLISKSGKCNSLLENEVLLIAAFLVVFLIPSNRKVQLISDTAPYITKQESKKQLEKKNMKRDFTSLSYFLKLTVSNCDNNPKPERRVGTIKKEGNSTNGFIW